MKKIILTSAMILSVVLLLSFAVDDSKNVIGTWEYSAPDASYEYQKGEFVFEKKGDKLTGYAMLDGYKVTLDDLKSEKNILTFNVYVEGEKVTLDLNFEKKSFSGTASYSEGELEITGKKKN